MRVERLPFTVYDIVGYLAPGFFIAWCTLLLFNKPEYGEFIFDERWKLFGESAYSNASAFAVYLILSYLTGHLVGMLSSVTVEKLKIQYLGYPSNYLMKQFEFKGAIKERSITKNIVPQFSQKRFWVNQALLMPLIPITLLLFFSGWFSVLTKTLPKSMAELVKKRYAETSGQKINDDDKEENWFLFVHYYVINNHPSALFRIYNYVTIYGFLRNMCFIFCLIFWFFIIDTFVSVDHLVFYSFIDFRVESKNFLPLALTIIIASVLYMAFIKFYRRYSEEALMAFITRHEDLENSTKDEC